VAANKEFNKIFYFEVNAFYGDDLNNLVELNLNRNHLNELDANDFDNLPKIQSLKFDFNKIKAIKENVFNSLENLVNISKHLA